MKELIEKLVREIQDIQRKKDPKGECDWCEDLKARVTDLQEDYNFSECDPNDEKAVKELAKELEDRLDNEWFYC